MERAGFQEYIQRLRSEYGYPDGSIRREVPYAFGKARYRLDLVVLKDEKPYIIVEIKRGFVDIIDQLLAYVRSTGAEFAVISDGYTDNCYMRVANALHETQLTLIPDIPSYGKTIEDIGCHTNSELIRINSEQLQQVILRIIDLVRQDLGVSRDQALQEVLKLLLLKVYDENSEEALFRARYNEPPENIKTRISGLAMRATRDYPGILEGPPEKLNTELLSSIVHKIQKYSIKGSGQEIVGSKLPIDEIYDRSSNLFSSPRKLIGLMIGLLNPEEGTTFLDSACGVGGLTLEAAKRGCKVVGIDVNPNTTLVARANLFLSNLTGYVFVQDSLESLDHFHPSILQHIPKEGFDYAAVVTPFGQRISDSRLGNFLLGASTRSQGIEVLFLERTLKLLKQGGKMAIVLPEGILLSASTLNVREFILGNSMVKAIISLPAGLFAPLSSIRTSLLLLEHSPTRGTSQQDKIFAAILDDMDHPEAVIARFRDFIEKGVVPREENIFVANIKSQDQLDAGYLKSLLSMQKWEKEQRYVELREIADITTGATLERIGENDRRGDARYVRAGNVEDFVVNLREDDIIRTTSDPYRWIAKDRDVLITRAGTVGRAAIVEGCSFPVIIGSNVARIRIHDNRVLPKFLLAYLHSKEGRAQIETYTAGSAIRAISTSGLGRIRIPLKPIEEQRRIASKVEEIIRKRRETTRILENLKLEEEKLLTELNDLI